MPAVGKSGPGTSLISSSISMQRVVDQQRGGGGQLAQVVRRDARRHADRDALAAVHQQVGQAGGQHRRLKADFGSKVGMPVDGLLAHVRQQVLRQLAELGLGVTHRGRRVAVDAAKVALRR